MPSRKCDDRHAECLTLCGHEQLLSSFSGEINQGLGRAYHTYRGA